MIKCIVPVAVISDRCDIHIKIYIFGLSDPHHEPSHPLLFDSFSLLLLLTLSVCVPVGDGSGEFLDFAGH